MSTPTQPPRVQREPHDDATVLRVDGALDDVGAAELRDALDVALTEGARRVLIDFHRVEYLSSVGIGMLVGLLKRCREAGATLTLSALRPPIRDLFELARLHRVFTIVEEETVWQETLGRSSSVDEDDELD